MGDGIKLHERSFQNKHRGVQPETPWCSRRNTAVFALKLRGVYFNAKGRVEKDIMKTRMRKSARKGNMKKK